MPTDNTQALKQLWRTHDRLSSCAPLAGKLKGLEAAKQGAEPIAANYVAQGYELPEGMTWADVEAARGDTPAHMVPVCRTPGACIAWGTPIVAGSYLLHPGNIRK